jgi:hypothetical protein
MAPHAPDWEDLRIFREVMRDGSLWAQPGGSASRNRPSAGAWMRSKLRSPSRSLRAPRAG